jgi:hypothetical protein
MSFHRNSTECITFIPWPSFWLAGNFGTDKPVRGGGHKYQQRHYKCEVAQTDIELDDSIHFRVRYPMF